LATNVTVKGQVILPKAVRQAAGIRPGEKVSVRVGPEGGLTQYDLHARMINLMSGIGINRAS
jgi:AbrB family looped-hinge helix DNA binding protein